MTPVVVECRAELRESLSVTVGQDEDAFPFMRGEDIGCSNRHPVRIEPEIGQIPENDGQSASGNKGRHIFQEDDPRSHFANAIPNIWPDPPFVLGALAFPRRAPWLTGETGSDEIHASTPAAAVEGEQVVPDRRRSQRAVCHTRDQPRGGKGFPLHVTDGAVIGDHEPDGEFKAASPGTKSHAIHQGLHSEGHAVRSSSEMFS